MIRLSLIGVRVEVPTNQPIVLLREEEGTRFLPIFIGSPEATAIVYALQGLATPRPLTHDLFKTVLDDLSVKLERVVRWIVRPLRWIFTDRSAEEWRTSTLTTTAPEAQCLRGTPPIDTLSSCWAPSPHGPLGRRGAPGSCRGIEFGGTG